MPVIRKILWIGCITASSISLAAAGGVGGVAGGVAAGVGGVAAGVGGVAAGVGGVAGGVAAGVGGVAAGVAGVGGVAGVAGVGVGLGAGTAAGLATGIGGKGGLGIGAATSGRVSNKFGVGDRSQCVVTSETAKRTIRHCQNFVSRYGATPRAGTRYRAVSQRRLREAAAHSVSPPVRSITPRATTSDYSLASFKEFLAQHGGANRSEKEIEELYVQFREWNSRPRK